MSGRFMETEKEEQKKLIDNKAAVEYEYGGVPELWSWPRSFQR